MVTKAAMQIEIDLLKDEIASLKEQLPIQDAYAGLRLRHDDYNGQDLMIVHSPHSPSDYDFGIIGLEDGEIVKKIWDNMGEVLFDLEELDSSRGLISYDDLLAYLRKYNWKELSNG